jgi:hypothetical protein
MRMKPALLQCLFALMGVATLGCCLLFPRTSIGVEQGGPACVVLTVPQPASDIARGSYWFNPYEFRWPDKTHASILFSLQSTYGNSGPYPAYRVSLAAPASIQTATKEDWDAGVEAALVPDRARSNAKSEFLEGPPPPLSNPPATKDVRTFTYNGRSFRKSGNLWLPFEPVLVAPGNGYVALQSWDGWVAGGRTSGDGSFFIDIYDASKERRIALVSGRRCNITPEYIFYSSGWLTDRDLVMPFPFDREPQILVCHFGR